MSKQIASEYMREIEILMCDHYNINNLVNIKTFKPIFSKFKNNSQHFFTVETSNSKYFIKRYLAIQKERAMNDISRSVEYRRRINILIPKFFKNKNKKYITNINNNYYVVIQYINGNDLRKINEISNNDEVFINLYLDTCLKLKKISSNYKFNFNSRISNFDRNIINLLAKLKTNKSISAKKHLKYVIFLQSEVNKYRDKINKISIRGQLIHGDLIKQNVVKDKDDNYWIVDWEKSDYGSVEIDIMRTLLFTYFKPNPNRVNLKPNNFIDVFVKHKKIVKSMIDNKTLNRITTIFYFYLITNISSLTRFYVDKIKLQKQILDEDINILKWYKKNMNKIQNGINQVS